MAVHEQLYIPPNNPQEFKVEGHAPLLTITCNASQQADGVVVLAVEDVVVVVVVFVLVELNNVVKLVQRLDAAVLAMVAVVLVAEANVLAVELIRFVIVAVGLLRGVGVVVA